MIYLSDLLCETKLPSSEIDMDSYARQYLKTVNYLKTKKKTLLLTTSNRWIQHKSCVGNPKYDTPLYRAMAKYGIENFTIEVIDKTIEVTYVPKLSIYAVVDEIDPVIDRVIEKYKR